MQRANSVQASSKANPWSSGWRFALICVVAFAFFKLVAAAFFADRAQLNSDKQDAAKAPLTVNTRAIDWEKGDISAPPPTN